MELDNALLWVEKNSWFRRDEDPTLVHGSRCVSVSTRDNGQEKQISKKRTASREK